MAYLMCTIFENDKINKHNITRMQQKRKEKYYQEKKFKRIKKTE